jgi:hypothetical protein
MKNFYEMSELLRLAKLNESVCDNADKLNEMQVEDLEMQDLIKQFAFLSDKIDRMKGLLHTLTVRYEEIEEVLRPILDEMKDTEDKTLQVENIIVTVKRYGYPRSSPAYKEAYLLLLNKVNGKLKEIAEECLAAHTKQIQVATSIGVQKTENYVSNLFGKATNKLYSFAKHIWIKVLSVIRRDNNEIQQAINEFKNEAGPF